KANVAVALLSAPITVTGTGSTANLRSALLNISAVRINQTATTNPNDPGWVTIPVPSSVSNGLGASGGDLQIDMIQAQTGAVSFNTSLAPQGLYQSVQVIVDPSNPGTIVPACQAVGSDDEGCINYPIALVNSSVIFTLSNPITVNRDVVAPLVIQLTIAINS